MKKLLYFISIFILSNLLLSQTVKVVGENFSESW